MGPGSLIRLPVRGKIDEDWEIILNCYALGYDTQNSILASHGKFVPTTYHEIKTRFSHLKRIARKYAPHKLRTVEAIEKLSMDNHAGRINDRSYVHRLRLIALSNGANTMLLDQAESRINAAEGMERMAYAPHGFSIFPQKPVTGMHSILKKSGKMFASMDRNMGVHKRRSAKPMRLFRPIRPAKPIRYKRIEPPKPPMHLIRGMFGGRRK